MAKFLVHGTYTPDGVMGLVKEGAAGRRDAIKGLLKSAGGKLDAMYYGIGADEVLAVADLPDNAAAARVSAAVTAAGLVSLVVTPLLTVEELDKAIKKGAKYRAPGQD